MAKRLTQANINDISNLLNTWNERIKDGSFNAHHFRVWIQGLFTTFKENEQTIRNLIKQYPDIVKELGGSVPTYSRIPKRRAGGCCGH